MRAATPLTVAASRSEVAARVTTERTARVVADFAQAWARRFQQDAADYDRQAQVAGDPYLLGYAAAKREDARLMQAAVVELTYVRRDQRTPELKVVS